MARPRVDGGQHTCHVSLVEFFQDKNCCRTPRGIGRVITMSSRPDILNTFIKLMNLSPRQDADWTAVKEEEPDQEPEEEFRHSHSQFL